MPVTVWWETHAAYFRDTAKPDAKLQAIENMRVLYNLVESMGMPSWLLAEPEDLPAQGIVYQPANPGCVSSQFVDELVSRMEEAKANSITAHALRRVGTYTPTLPDQSALAAIRGGLDPAKLPALRVFHGYNQRKRNEPKAVLQIEHFRLALCLVYGRCVAWQAVGAFHGMKSGLLGFWVESVASAFRAAFAWRIIPHAAKAHRPGRYRCAET